LPPCFIFFAHGDITFYVASLYGFCDQAQIISNPSFIGCNKTVENNVGDVAYLR